MKTMAHYRVALIGLGRIASTIDDEVQGYSSVLLPYAHMACYQEIPDVEVVAGADPFDEQREAFHQRWGISRLYSDYRELLDQEKPDIVSVCTSAKPRPDIVVDCARAGVKGIFAEKPIAFRLDEADAMIAACQEHGAKLAINCTRHYDGIWNRARELIDAGEIGPVVQVTAYGRSGISHNGSHLLDLVRYLTGGETIWVTGEMESDTKARGDGDLMGNGYLAFDNGARAFVRMLPTGGAEWQIEVVGERGGFRRRQDRLEVAYWQVQGGRRPETIIRDFPNPQRFESMHLRALRDLVECVDTGREPRCRGEDGRAVLEIALALRESHRQDGRRIRLPLADRSLAIRSSETLQGDLPAAIRRAREHA
jgi:predicted dehydrogenase